MLIFDSIFDSFGSNFKSQNYSTPPGLTVNDSVGSWLEHFPTQPIPTFNSNLHTLFKKITPKTGLLTRKCTFNCNFHMGRTQFKRRIVLERIQYVYLGLKKGILSKWVFQKHWWHKYNRNFESKMGETQFHNFGSKMEELKLGPILSKGVFQKLWQH